MRISNNPVLFAALSCFALLACQAHVGSSTDGEVPEQFAVSPVERAPVISDDLLETFASAVPSELVESKDVEAALRLSIWSSPSFQRRFQESYLAETEVEPTLTADERLRMQKVLELLSEDKTEAAVELLITHATGASSAVFDFTLGNLYFQEESLEQARAAYEAAVEKYPKFLRAWKNLGMIRVRRGEFSEAIEPLTRVIELGGSDGVNYGLLGFAYSNESRDLAAESAYRMAILLDPNTRDWQMGLARSFFRQQRFADAASLCASMILTHPEQAELWLLQANALLGLGKTLEAAQNFELVDSLGGSTADSLNMLGDIYINEELYELATDGYLRALKIAGSGGSERALTSARVLVARSANAQAAELLDALEVGQGADLDESGRKSLLKVRARIAVAMGAGEDEARILREIVELDPLDGEALILLGQHSRRSDDAEQAIFYFERAAGIEAFEADAKVRHAQTLVGLGKYSEALPLLRRAQAIDERDHIREYIEQIERIVNKR
mgnify:CR=1 FL=1|jgi:tetratricopeptide (TPR) repeat protein